MVKETGITVKKSQDFSEWYIQVVLKSELTDYSSAKGFMVLRPYGFAIWEKIRDYFEAMIRARGHVNAYFPTLIPENLIKKEAEHFTGFNPEVFWVSHAGDAELPERLAVRPTSETIIYESYAKWVRSWRDLPILINVWNSVLRAEIKSTKPFIRTSEFLWQEGHTVHATKEDADREVYLILGLYKKLMENYLAIPVLEGLKTDKEKFVGALYTTTLEAMMSDGKVLQMGTSHNLGQNFSMPFGIKFVDKEGKESYAWTASWGISWRIIGAMVMVHGDDKGLVIPPPVAPIQVVIVPIFYSEEEKSKVLKEARRVMALLKRSKIRALLDDREEYTPGWKFNEWELKGVPLRLEIGPKDVESRTVTLVRRDKMEKARESADNPARNVKIILGKITESMFNRAKELLSRMTKEARTYQELKEKVEAGFVRASWCGTTQCEDRVKEETGADIRLLPLKKEEPFGPCVACSSKAEHVAYFGRAY